MQHEVMVVFGTRPEAIKMLPVIKALRAFPDVAVRVVITAQHREMLDQVLGPFGITPDIDLDLMEAGQGLPALFARILTGMSDVLADSCPDIVLVHGDTSTTLSAALASFYARIPIGHVEAGLRTGDLDAPWPEEANRRLTGQLATLHFAPTTTARARLLSEGVDEGAIHVTGNTVVDALQMAVARIEGDRALAAGLEARLEFLDRSRRLVLVTGHRRESFGVGLHQLCLALRQIASRDDVQVVYPVHPNPSVKGPVESLLGDACNVVLLPPQDYLPFVELMRRAAIILTDSGGIQEEAPSLGKPVLLLRETTERPEGVTAGSVRLVGMDTGRIVAETNRLLDDPSAYAAMASVRNPYGDGRASGRIADAVHAWLAHRDSSSAEAISSRPRRAFDP